MRLKNVMRNAIFAVWISLLIGIGVAPAQERSWEVSAFVASYGLHYSEDITRRSDQPGDLTGNSFTAAALQASITYDMRHDLNVPFFLGLHGSLPLATLRGLEVGHMMKSDQLFVTQREDVMHSASSLDAQLGFEMLPEIQPYAKFEYSSLASRRLSQQNGNDNGSFSPSPNQDYTETVKSTHLGFGLMGTIGLDDNAAYRLRYDAGYEIPQTVTVTNSYFDSGVWGQGTTGYTLNGRLALDLPFTLIPAQRDRNGYITIGALFSKRHWDGNGRIATEIFGNPRWPANDAVMAGGFIGTGLFF